MIDVCLRALHGASVRTLSSLAMAAALLLTCAFAHADTIVDNGFESAGGGNVYFAGQSIDGGSWTVSRGAVYIDSMDPYVYDGNNSLNLTLANLYTSNAITQLFSTVAGQQYTLSFYANADAANIFSILINGSLLAGGPSSIAQNGFPSDTTNSSSFTQYSDGFVATSNSTALTFLATANPSIGSPTGSVLVDDVSTSTAVTPEPSSVLLVLTGLTGLGGIVLRKRLQRA